MAHCGTTTAYAAGCHCADCRRAHAEYRAAQREREREQRAADGLPIVDLLGVESPDWYEHAECRGAPQAIFFPDWGESTEPAKGICAACPVSVECLAWALDHGEKFGIWGGTSERERRRMRRDWEKVA